MKTAVPKNERVLNLLAYLLRSRRAVPFEEIRSQVEGYNDKRTAEPAVARRFERDKKVLRDLGVEITWDDDPVEGRPGYFIRKPAVYMGDVTLTDREVRLLSVLASFGREKSGPLLANLASACQKLLARSPLQEPALRSAHRRLVYPAKAAQNRTLSANLELFMIALAESRRAAFTYHSMSRDTTALRVVEPYGVKFFKGEWYLVGRCCDAGEPRIFRLDRISGKARFESESGAYSVPAGFSVADYVGRGPWELSRSEPTAVSVRLDDIGAWIVEEARPAGVTMKRGRGGATATFEVRKADGFFKWLVPLGTHAKIVSPREMAEGYVAFLKGMLG